MKESLFPGFSLKPEHIKAISSSLQAVSALDDPRDQGAVLNAIILAWIELSPISQEITRSMFAKSVLEFKMSKEEAERCLIGLP